ncbi:MAG: DNA/RNA nuclease SfsA [Vampirovibrio sp.]|nr:DNA/RNA nuclease SfsA [Vampirovibrio sp.]
MDPISLNLDLIPAEFVERPNRFVSVAKLIEEAGQPIVKAHVPDPGRLKELLLPGVRVLVEDHGEKASRKLRYTLHMVYSPEDGGKTLVSINTQHPNRLVKGLLGDNKLPGYESYQLIKPEFTYGKSRLDFLLESPTGKKTLMEVKAVNLVVDETALFPDAPTVRGVRHIEELTEALKDGYESHIVFIIQRADVKRFSPNHVTDPALADALEKAMSAGVQVHAFCFELTPQTYTFRGEVPVVLPVVV